MRINKNDRNWVKMRCMICKKQFFIRRTSPLQVKGVGVCPKHNDNVKKGTYYIKQLLG